MAGRQYHLQACPGDIAPYVLLPGDPGRVQRVTSLWDDVQCIATNREYVTHTGYFGGTRMSCVSTGIGGPSTAIAMEELARLGARTFLRIGTCGTFQDNVQTGDLAIFDSAMRLDGTSVSYAPAEFPAVADPEIVLTARDVAVRLGYRAHVGTTRTADTFYARHGQPGASFGGYWQSGWREHFDDLRRLNVLAGEMEASVVLVLARLWGLRAGAIAVVLDNIIEVGSAKEAFDPTQQFLADGDAITRLVEVGCHTLQSIAQEAERG